MFILNEQDLKEVVYKVNSNIFTNLSWFEIGHDTESAIVQKNWEMIQ